MEKEVRDEKKRVNGRPEHKTVSGLANERSEFEAVKDRRIAVAEGALRKNEFEFLKAAWEPTSESDVKQLVPDETGSGSIVLVGNTNVVESPAESVSLKRDSVSLTHNCREMLLNKIEPTSLWLDYFADSKMSSNRKRLRSEFDSWLRQNSLVASDR